MKKNNLLQKEGTYKATQANEFAAASVKVFAVKSMSITDYVIQMKNGKNVYVFDGIEQLSASGVEKSVARSFRQLVPVSPAKPEYQKAIDLYKKRLAEVTLPEVLAMN